MGSGQSTRRLTINNEDGSVIGISKSVVQRLSNKVDEMQGGMINEVRSANVMSPSSPNIVHPPLNESSHTEQNYDYPAYSSYLTISALQVQQQKLEELRNQDDYWQQRLKNLEQKHAHIDEIINAEYKKAVEQIYGTGKKGSNVQNTIQPCKANSQKVLKCYQAHPKEILQCSNLVEEFATCVDQHRARVIAARC